MDPALVIPIGGMITTIVGTVAISWAVVQGIRIKNQPRIGDSELARAVGDLEARVDQLQQQLNEAQERIDFAERLLTRGRDSHEGIA
jgi:outer membrane murein-binding lipoprotein Lpp